MFFGRSSHKNREKAARMDGFFPQSEDKMRVNERDSAIKENEKAMIKRLSDIRPCLKIVRTPIDGSFSATLR